MNRDKEVDASETILGLITESSAFTQERFSTIREGVQAFLDRDNTKAIHVLIPQIEASLRRLYMMALLSDERGLNLRNEICHGLARPEVFSQQVADLILHAILIISRIGQPANEAPVSPP